MKRIIISSILIYSLSIVQAQVSTIGNSGISSDFLGWATGSNLDLEIRHDNPNGLIRVGTLVGGPNAFRIQPQGEISFGATSFGAGGLNILLSSSFGGGNLNTGLRSQILYSPLIGKPVYGGYFITRNDSRTSYGIYGVPQTPSGGSSEGYGIRAEVCNVSGRGYAVYGESTPINNSWAGWFNGDVFSGGLWPVSDQNLKTEIIELSNSTSILLNMNPVSYNFRTDDFAYLNLPVGLQFGFVAQELAEILPSLVKYAVNPTEYDDGNNQVGENIELLGVNYLQIIPLILGSLKERELLILSQEEELLILEEEISALESLMGLDLIIE
jgi:hypothetical protein